jgi:uncharacterized membrane protein
MNFEPLLSASPQVMIHIGTIVPAFAIGTWLLLFSEKGSGRHRALGKVYLSLMLITAAAASFISSPINLPYVDIGALRFGPIHLFVPLTLWGVWSALITIKRGNIVGHRSAMLGLYIGGLLIAGTLAFMPGRIMNRIFFG